MHTMFGSGPTDVAWFFFLFCVTVYLRTALYRSVVVGHDYHSFFENPVLYRLPLFGHLEFRAYCTGHRGARATAWSRPRSRR